MDEAARRLILGLHNAGYQYTAAVTGGGAQAMAMLLNVPGSSRALLEVLVPYHTQSLAEFLGCEPEQSCSADTAQLMARRALERAAVLAPGQRVAGIGCTASLVTDRPKQGDHRFHIAVATENGVSTWSLTLNKGSRDREGEEALLDAILLDAMAAVFGVHERIGPTLLEGEKLLVENHPADEQLARLYRSEISALCVEVLTEASLEAVRASLNAIRTQLLFPGSFNPLHEGHLGCATAAARRTGLPVAYEIGVENVDKPPLIVEDVCRRVAQFRGKAPVWLTRAPTFAAKAPLFPGTTFVVGSDTAERLLQPRYYGGSETQLLAALESIRVQGCRFLVVGRYDAESGRFQTLDDLPIPPSLRDLFDAVPESEFRLDVSSTEVRARQKGNEDTC
jgi:nicotinamide mononucleotide (NMN) deamidase PncC